VGTNCPGMAVEKDSFVGGTSPPRSEGEALRDVAFFATLCRLRFLWRFGEPEVFGMEWNCRVGFHLMI
jgi:hypothetical protein